VLLRGVKADGVLLDLDLAGVTASTGSACGTLTGMPSATLRAMGVRADEVQGALCMTLGRWSGAVDVEAVLDRLPAIVARLRSLSPAAS
jgi:cysteine desulfurase